MELKQMLLTVAKDGLGMWRNIDHVCFYVGETKTVQECKGERKKIYLNDYAECLTFFFFLFNCSHI